MAELVMVRSTQMIVYHFRVLTVLFCRRQVKEPSRHTNLDILLNFLVGQPSWVRIPLSSIIFLPSRGFGSRMRPLPCIAEG